MLSFVWFLIAGRKDTNEIPLPMFSAYCMAFYATSFAVYYSRLHLEKHDETRRCPNGHVVSPLAKYCEECGQPIWDEFQVGGKFG